MRKLLTFLLLSFAAASALAQKGPLDELGFQAERVYDFTNVDSVNLYNGNLSLSIPIGMRYKVGGSLSYQLSLTYNGKIWDNETWTCLDNNNNPTECGRTMPNLRSNAGLGWRVSLGRLLPPYDTGLENHSLTDLSWVYEGPAGDEHALGASDSANTQTNAHDGMRMRRIDAITRDVEFGSGEVHRFVKEFNVWRLKQVRDRFNNAMNIAYTYSSNGQRELQWTITDTAGRTHYVYLGYNYSSMADGWSRGQNVSYIDMQGFNGGRAPYTFGYTPYNTSTACFIGVVPGLTSLQLPDTSSYQFSYFVSPTVCNVMGALNAFTYPTGGTVSYTWRGYLAVPQDSICSGANQVSLGVDTRTINDGTSSRVWQYVQQTGPVVPSNHYVPDPCNQGTSPPSFAAPIYWARTSVLSPADATNRRVRTDHYFSIFSDGSADFTTMNPLSGEGLQRYSHEGVIGAPPPSVRKGPAVIDVYTYGPDVDAADDPASPARLLATEVYANCNSLGDCTNGTLMRSTYDRYIGDVYSNRPYHPVDTARLITSRTVFHDDTATPNDVACGTSPCYTQVTYSDDNGAEQFRTTTRESNFPGSQTVTTTTQYPSWTASDLTDPNRLWVLDNYTEKSRSEGGVTAREHFCFASDTGVLLRHRTLAGSSPGEHDVLHVFSYTLKGDLQFSYDYGADLQTVDTGVDLCSIPLPTQARYKIENTYLTTVNNVDVYTGGVAATSRYFNRDTGVALGFLSLDRSIDPSTGVVTASRDSAGVTTTFGYTAVPARLETMTAPSGAVTTYTYTPATGAVTSSWSPATVDVVTIAGSDSIRAQYVYDGIGRVKRDSHLAPSNQWFATETAYDEMARLAWKSQPESTGANPPTGPLVAAHKTSYTYDAFGRNATVTAPDNKSVSFTYSGIRRRRKTMSVATDSGEVPVTTAETYDASGRLTTVIEAEGNSYEATTGYTYDVAGRLAGVSMLNGVQTRTFNYDLRGFLTYERHPEIGVNGNSMVVYGDYDARGHAGRRTTGFANTLLDVTYTFDSAERVTAIDDFGVFKRPLKRFSYADTNAGADARKGKLFQTVRYNHLTTGDVTVTETFEYANSFGTPSKRQTLVQSGSTTLQSFTQNFTYDPLGALGQIDYPVCDAVAPCGGSPPGPVPYARSKGFLIGVSPYAPAITYNPDSSVHQVVHGTSPQVTDTYAPDPSGITRASLIKFTGMQACNGPVATVSGGGTIPPNGSTQIQATLTGTAPWSVRWSDGVEQNGIMTSTITRTVSPPATTTYTITAVADANCAGSSNGFATVTVSCTAPTAAVSGGGSVTPGNSAQIQATLTGAAPWSITWSDGFQQSGINTSVVTRTVTPSQTTTYTIVAVSDSHCSGSSSGSATVIVGLNTPAGFSATTITGNTLQVAMSWNGVQGAGWYQVERSTVVNGAYAPVGPRLAATSFTDTFGATTPVTYLYRVRAGATFGGVDTLSSPSGMDYATVATALFTNDPITSFVTPIRGVHISEMRQAVDAVRIAAGLQPAWGSYAPLVGVVFASHNVTARTQLDAAANILLGHGIFYSGETPSTNGVIRGYQVQQIREGVK